MKAHGAEVSFSHMLLPGSEQTLMDFQDVHREQTWCPTKVHTATQRSSCEADMGGY